MRDVGLEDLLDQAHNAVLVADFAALSVIGPQIEAALQRFQPGENAELLERVRRKASRNATCLLSAGRGVKAAMRRLNDVRRAAGGLATYDGKGKRCEQPVGGTMTRRF